MPWTREPPAPWTAVLALVLLLAGPVADGDAPQRHELRVLFIGNSLTYSNDMPAMVEGMLLTAGLSSVEVDTVAFPNYGLEDHWLRGPARRRIAQGGWDVVVLQQGPSATEGRPSLFTYSKRLAKKIEQAGGTAALYMVWPSEARSFDFDGVIDSYSTAAEGAGAVLLPVGIAWREAWARDPEIPLYGHDGFHPSVLGSYLAALVIYERLSGRDPRDLPPRIPAEPRPIDLPPDLARLLQEAARAASASMVPETTP